jgi:SEC-C motif-containing protein
VSSDSKEPCPCGSGSPFSACCEPYLEGEDLPQRAEQLMRSRYCAFVMGNSAYLLQTWHESTRSEKLQLEQGVNWFGLQVVETQAGEADDDEGWVEFIAKFKGHDRLQYLHERSHFLREDGRWYYVDGQIYQQPKADKIGRNDPCPCGSGKKFKRCCGLLN